MFEGRQPDRTNHRREIESRRADRRGPSPRRIGEALDTIAAHDVPGQPRAGTLKVLRELHDSEWTTDTRNVRDFSITRGDPQHGAHRSDDHIGRYQLELPLSEVSDEAVCGSECPHCDNTGALYKYRAHHHIAGSESVFCLQCEEVLYSKKWG